MLDYIKPFFGKLTTFAKQRMGFDRPPRLFLKQDKDNSSKVFGKTAFYDRDNESITIFVNGRHPKDILRSYAHELVHHAQNCRGDLQNTGEMDKNYAQNNKHMRNMEKEAYLVGNMCFRDFEDSLQDKEVHIIKLAESSFLKENKKVKTKITKEVLKEMIKETIGKVLSEEPQLGLRFRPQDDDAEELGSGAIGGLGPLPPEPELTGRKQMTKRLRPGEEKPAVAVSDEDDSPPIKGVGSMKFKPQTGDGREYGAGAIDSDLGPLPDMPEVQLTQRKQTLRKALEGGDAGLLSDVEPRPAPEKKKVNLDKTIIPFLKGFHTNQYYGVMPNLESEPSFGAAYNFARNEYKVPYFHYGPNAKYEVYSTGLGRKGLTLSQMENIKKEYAAYAFDEIMNNPEFFDDIAASLPQADEEEDKKIMKALDNIPVDDTIMDLKEKKAKKKSKAKGKIPKTPKEKKFAKLAPPKNKITYADKIAGATQVAEGKIQTPEQENVLYEQRFTPKNNRLFEKLLKEWTK